MTTIRRTPGEIFALGQTKEIQASEVDVSDRFGDYGLTGVLFLRVDNTVAVVDTFLLSCRVLGRGVEESVVRQLGLWAHDLGLKYLKFEYRPTPRNAPAREFLHRAFAQFEVNAVSGSVYEVPVQYASALAPRQRIRHVGQQTLSDATAAAQSASSYFEWQRASTFPYVNSLADMVRAMDRFRAARRTTTSVPSSLETGVDTVSGGGTPPAGVLEEALAGIWRSLLAVELVNRNDDFFELGGESVLVLKLISRIAQRFSVQPSIAAILRSHCLADMAMLIAALDVRPQVSVGVEVEAGAI
jgi:hypothetical protein